VWLVVASSLGYAGSILREWVQKRRSPAEEAKTHAEARQIDANTNLDLLKAATDALTKASRLQDERNHWELKAFDLQAELKEARAEISTLQIQAQMDNYQLVRQMAFITAKRLKKEFIAFTDKPKE
jgi:hypothetical protein